MEKVISYFNKHADLEYKKFISNLSPSVQEKDIIGVRVPLIRSLTKELSKEEIKQFLNELPHQYYEENLLHAFLIGKIKNYEECINEIEKFLPFANAWAITDTMSPKVMIKHTEELLPYIKSWIKDKHVYTERFAIWCLMTYYLDDNFKEEYLHYPDMAKSDDYYVKMMIAWYYATALTKQYESAIKIIEENKLDKWIHNKSIQKTIESFRISDEKKIYLRTLKRK